MMEVGNLPGSFSQTEDVVVRHRREEEENENNGNQKPK